MGNTLETKRRAASAESAQDVEFLGRGVPIPSRLGSLGERRELPQRGPGQSPGRQRILSIFQGLRSLLVETIHYGVYGIVRCENY